MARLVRWLLVAIAAALLAGGALSLVLRVELWDADKLLRAELYSQLYTLHGMIMLRLVFEPAALLILPLLVLTDLLRPRRVAMPLAWMACLAWLAGGAIVLAAPFNSGWAAYAPRGGLLLWTTVGFAIQAAGLALAATFFLLMLVRGATDRGSPAPFRWIALATVAVQLIQAVLYILVALEIRPLDALAAVRPLCLLAVGSSLAALVGRLCDVREGGAWIVVFAFCAFVSPLLPLGSWTLLPFVAGRILFAGALARWILASPARTSPALLVTGLAILPALVVGSLLSAFLGLLAPDIFLHDTTFAVAAFHLDAAVVVLGLPVAALAYADVLGLTVRARMARVASVVLAAGFTTFVITMATLGSSGMPRRYQQFLDVFEPRQRLASIAAAITVAGALALLASFRRNIPARGR